MPYRGLQTLLPSTLHNGVQDSVFLVAILVEHNLTFGFPDALHYDLLGSLGSYATENPCCLPRTRWCLLLGAFFILLGIGNTNL
jgi:hypothetical protein